MKTNVKIAKTNVKIVKTNVKIVKTAKSMIESLDTNEVLLWGLNQIDSILLSQYDNSFVNLKKTYNKKKT